VPTRELLTLAVCNIRSPFVRSEAAGKCLSSSLREIGAVVRSSEKHWPVDRCSEWRTGAESRKAHFEIVRLWRGGRGVSRLDRDSTSFGPQSESKCSPSELENGFPHWQCLAQESQRRATGSVIDSGTAHMAMVPIKHIMLIGDYSRPALYWRFAWPGLWPRSRLR
jgi:hypothetical protein